MEFVDGLDLAKLVKAKGPMSVAHAAYFVHQAALGLQHAHEQGMVHRDIKPGNLMLARKGDKSIVKVLDFGLAKATRESPLDGGLTQEGQMLGTPDFIAPEQIRDAQSAGIQADIYSLGCTLYYLLTGKPPFEAKSLYDLLQAHFSMDAQPLNLTRPDVPVELAALVAKMMAKDIDRRFQTPGAVAESLKPFFRKAVSAARAEISTFGEPKARLNDVKGPIPATDSATQDAPKQSGAASLSQPSSPALPAGRALAEPANSVDVAPAANVASSGPRSRRRWKSRPVATAAGAFGVLILGIIILIFTKDGPVTVKTENGKSVTIAGATNQDRGGSSANEGKPSDSRVKAGERTTSAFVSDQATVREPSTAGADTAWADHPKATTTPTPAAVAVTQPRMASANPPVYINSIRMKLALLPGGEFMMGAPDNDELAHPIEKPQHQVGLSPFFMGVYEVTQAQYKAVMGNNPSYFSATGGGKNQINGEPTDEQPVEKVTWLDAAMFCNKLSEREGRSLFYQETGQDDRAKRTGPGYRLPTEAEWEFACRAGAQTRYCFGDDAWILSKYTGTGGRPHAVGTTHPNRFGLYDMHGNVWEWCSDWFGPEYYSQPHSRDPQGPPLGGKRVYRGGGWDSDPFKCTSTYREKDPPLDTNIIVGFRIALSGPAETAGLTLIPSPSPTATSDNGTRTPPSDAKPDRVPTETAETGLPGRGGPVTAAGLPKGKQPPVTENSIGMKLALIPGGEFTMGSPDSDLWAGVNEKPQHRVRFEQSFYLGVCEVTQSQYRTVTADFPEKNVWFVDGDDIPIYYVSWKDALEFCNALSKRERLTPYYNVNGGLRTGGDGYRLPTEAEWEYACRGTRVPLPLR